MRMLLMTGTEVINLNCRIIFYDRRLVSYNTTVTELLFSSHIDSVWLQLLISHRLFPYCL